MFEFPANFLFIVSHISDSFKFDKNWGLIGDSGTMAYMMMRKRNTSTFKNKTGLGY